MSIWQNVTYSETNTLRKMSDPRTVVQWLTWPSGKKSLETLSQKVTQHKVSQRFSDFTSAV